MNPEQRFNQECDDADRLARELEFEMPKGYLELWPVKKEWRWAMADAEDYVRPPSRGMKTTRTPEQKRQHWAATRPR